MRLAVAALALCGCLGPVLPLPRHPRAPHEWLCVNVACPAVEPGGLVIGARYDASTRRCQCLVEDARHLPRTEYPDPHAR